MDKRKRHNLLLTLAIIILVVGVAVQLYLMVKSGEQSDRADLPPSSAEQTR